MYIFCLRFEFKVKVYISLSEIESEIVDKANQRLPVKSFSVSVPLTVVAVSLHASIATV